MTASSHETIIHPSTSTTMKRVLIVDDMRINLMVLAAKVRKLNCICEVAESALQALRLVPSFKPDLLLTDLWMPEMNGDVLAHSVRKIPEFKDVPIFVVTAELESPTEFDMNVFNGLLQKPIDDDKLKEIIESTRAASS